MRQKQNPGGEERMGPRAQEKRLALARSRNRSSTQRKGRKVGSGIRCR